MPALENQILYSCRDPDTFVYHYTKASTLLQYILPNYCLRLSKYDKTNDPKETKDWSFSIGANEERDLSNYSLGELSRRMTRLFKERTKVLCVTRDGDLTGNHIEDIHQRGFCRPRMWAQYAEGHSGVCLVLDKLYLAKGINAVANNRGMLLEGIVSYCDRRIISDLHTSPYAINADLLLRLGEVPYAALHIQNHHKRLFFEKALDWRDEREHRWIVFDTDNGDIFVSLDQVLKGIVFGADTSESIISEIVDSSRTHSLWFEQLVWKGCSPWYSFNYRWPRV